MSNWTKDAPTEEGWYWVRGEWDLEPIQPAYLSRHNGRWINHPPHQSFPEYGYEASDYLPWPFQPGSLRSTLKASPPPVDPSKASD